MKWKAIIVDDEELGQKNLKTLVTNYCRHIQIMGIAGSVPEARELILQYNPEIIFLDINMPGEDGFELVKNLNGENSPLIVFVTAYEYYAIKAIKAKAFDYILKPIDVDELQDCEAKLVEALEKRNRNGVNEDEILHDEEKISINHVRGIKIINLKDIIYLEADNCYSVIHMYANGEYEKFVASRTLGDFEDVLNDKGFFRVHKSFLINAGQIKEYKKDDNTYVVMTDNSKIEISRRRNPAFKLFLNNNYNKFTRPDK